MTKRNSNYAEQEYTALPSNATPPTGVSASTNADGSTKTAFDTFVCDAVQLKNAAKKFPSGDANEITVMVFIENQTDGYPIAPGEAIYITGLSNMNQVKIVNAAAEASAVKIYGQAYKM